MDSRAVWLDLPASRMAVLHLANLRTWRDDEHSLRAFERAELDALEATLARIVDGTEPAAPVRNLIRQVVAERPG